MPVCVCVPCDCVLWHASGLLFMPFMRHRAPNRKIHDSAQQISAFIFGFSHSTYACSLPPSSFPPPPLLFYFLFTVQFMLCHTHPPAHWSTFTAHWSKFLLTQPQPPVPKEILMFLNERSVIQIFISTNDN